MVMVKEKKLLVPKFKIGTNLFTETCNFNIFFLDSF